MPPLTGGPTNQMLPLDVMPKGLDRGIEGAVRQLRAWGYPTTDSGDNASKPPEGRTVEAPHVFIVYWTRADLPAPEGVRSCDRLWNLLGQWPRRRSEIQVQGMYDPADTSFVILVTGDGLLEWDREDFQAVSTDDAGVC